MRVLVVGSGAREHCLADKLAKSPAVKKIYCAPGNGGTAQLGQNVDIKAKDIQGLLNLACNKKIDLTVVGPEAPLAEGIVDLFSRKGLLIFGPNKELAQLESSKVFAKKIMRHFNIPTAGFEVFTDLEKARKYIQSKKAPLVVKADGLTAGKGVMVCAGKKEAEKAAEVMLKKKKFGSAGDKIIIEDFLEGQELSLLALSDGKTILPLVASQDYKRAWDKDCGPNTGGMGAYSPVSFLGKQRLRQIEKAVFKPLLEGLSRENKPYKGILYAGLMIKGDKIYVLEFNVRLGDPEAQVILPKIKNDFAQVILKTVESRLEEVNLEWDRRSCLCLVLASGGYPGNYQKGKEIKGIFEAAGQKDVLVYHAGTQRKNGKLITQGGRVLSVVALGSDMREAKIKAYQAAGKISFAGMQYRKDIGDKAITNG